MSITYEEALGTLQAMFGEPWTRESLDAVLRHEKGHMENTCERILNHGSQHPQILVDRLKTTGGGNNGADIMDEALARQLQQDDQQSFNGRRQGGTVSSAVTTPNALPARTERGTPTELPKDFLRIPGYNHRSLVGAGSGAERGAAMDDETLARMLQDELFSEELARNPDFAHLARGGRGGSSSHRGVPPGQRRGNASNATAPNPFDGVPNVMENLSSTSIWISIGSSQVQICRRTLTPCLFNHLLFCISISYRAW